MIFKINQVFTLSPLKEMRGRLSGLSEQRSQLAMEIRDSIIRNPNSSLSQKLLDELKEVGFILVLACSYAHNLLM